MPEQRYHECASRTDHWLQDANQNCLASNTKKHYCSVKGTKHGLSMAWASKPLGTVAAPIQAYSMRTHTGSHTLCKLSPIPMISVSSSTLLPQGGRTAYTQAHPVSCPQCLVLSADPYASPREYALSPNTVTTVSKTLACESVWAGEAEKRRTLVQGKSTGYYKLRQHSITYY